MTDDETEKKQIAVRLTPEKKAKWNQYQEDLGLGSRETMIRKAVEHYHSVKVGDGGDEQLTQLSRQMDDVLDAIERVKLDVADVRRGQITRDDIPDIAEEVSFVMASNFTLSVDELIERHVDPDIDLDDEMEQVAVEQYLTGFAKAVSAISDESERERMMGILEAQTEEMWDVDISSLLDSADDS
ncbi:hypothetical protein [Haloarcula brevis]|uniref:hypothetical protein n=1 Tax=Haloarcula brevis TaxID=3111453 RepID=UPI00300F62AE